MEDPATDAQPGESTCTLKRYRREDMDEKRIRAASLKPQLLGEMTPANQKYQKFVKKRLLEDLDLDYHSAAVAIHQASKTNLRSEFAVQPPAPSANRRLIFDKMKPHPELPSNRSEVALRSPPLNRPSHSPLHMMLNPSRIPTPTNGAGKPRTLRYASSPAALGRTERKENVPLKQTRLMGTVSPYSQPTTSLTKSRTMGVLSSIKSSFSRSDLISHASNRQSSDNRKSSGSSFAGSHSDLSQSKSFVSLRTTSTPTTALSEVYAAPTIHSRASSMSKPLPPINEEEAIKQVHDAMPSCYWSGRLNGLYNLYCDEMLQATVNDPAKLRSATAPTPEGFVPPHLFKDKKNSNFSKKSSGNDDPNDEDRAASSLMLDNHAEKRMVRALKTLDGYCMNKVAKQSFREFQLAFARKEAVSAYLPAGGHMTDSWITKVMKKDKKKDKETSFGAGRRTGLSQFGVSRGDVSKP